jgi:hypothetical protein
LLIDIVENVCRASRDDASFLLVEQVLTHHGMGLSRASLTVRKDRSVVSFNNILTDRLARDIEYTLLLCVGIENAIKRERFKLRFAMVHSNLGITHIGNLLRKILYIRF